MSNLNSFMGLLFYNTAIFLFGLLMRFVASFNTKARKWVMGRKDVFKELESKLNKNVSPVLWFHCASLGEFEQGRPLIEKLKEENPEFKIMLTFFSPSGYEVRKNYEKADWVFYLPLDTAANAKAFIEIVKPKMAFFIKYEFWFNYVNELSLRHIPVYSVSTIFRQNQIFFKPYGGFMRKLLNKFTIIFVQDEASQKLLQTIGIKSIISGDTRFDRVKFLCDHRRQLPIIEKFKGDNKLLVIGSSWPADFEILFPSIRNAGSDLKIIIAPHEVHESNLQNLTGSLNLPYILHSGAINNGSSDANILIIDNVGMLSSIYAYADFAYVGGAFGKGLHNILEAATYGMPVFFGPNYSKFNEAVELIALGGAFSVKNETEFKTAFNKMLLNEESRQIVAKISRQYIDDHIGATEIIVKNLEFIRK